MYLLPPPEGLGLDSDFGLKEICTSKEKLGFESGFFQANDKYTGKDSYSRSRISSLVRVLSRQEFILYKVLKILVRNGTFKDLILYQAIYSSYYSWVASFLDFDVINFIILLYQPTDIYMGFF